MSLLATGLSAIGSIMGGIGKSNAGKARAKALGYAATNARREAGIKASLAMEDADRTGARAATLAAASGAGGLEGSALAVIEDLARQGVYRARQTVRDGISESIALMHDATTARRQASLDLTTGFIEAGSTVLSGIGQEANARRAGGQDVPKWMAMLGGF